MIDFKNRNVILLLATVVLSIGAFLINDPFGMFETSYKNAPFLLKNYKIDSVKKITVTEAGNLKYHFEKKNGEWTVKTPDTAEPFRANYSNISKGLENLQQMRKYQVVASREEKQKDFQVTDKDFLVEVTGEQDTFRIFLGKQGESFNSTLVRLDKDRDIYSVSGNLRADWAADLDFFRDKKVFHFVKENVKSVTISSAKYNYNLALNELNKWQLKMKGSDKPAQKSRVDNLLTQLTSLEGTKFYNEKKAPGKHAVIDLELNNSIKAKLEVFGPTKENEYIITSSQAGSAMLVPKFKIDGIIADPSEIEDKEAPKNSGGGLKLDPNQLKMPQ